MLGFFTDWYDEEIVFSGVSRFLARSGLKPTKGNIDSIVSSQRIALRVDLPEALKDLLDHLPSVHNYTPEILLNSRYAARRIG